MGAPLDFLKSRTAARRVGRGGPRTNSPPLKMGSMISRTGPTLPPPAGTSAVEPTLPSDKNARATGTRQERLTPRAAPAAQPDQ